jgi:GTP pyrophosphokinase
MKKIAEKDLEKLKSIVAKHHPNAKLSLVEEAYYFSKKAHKGQYRLSGEPYFTHPFQVAKMIAEKGLDEVIVSAALLHDILEDTKTTEKQIKSIFGKEIYSLVKSLTKLDIISFKSRKEHTTANIIRTIIASAKDIRVLVIKLFDKLHNLKTIEHLSYEKQIRIASDALIVYVPISHRMGIHSIKYELEDLCFKTLEPKNYKKIKDEIKPLMKEKYEEIKNAIKILKYKFPKMNWRLTTTKKSLYSIHSKMIAKGKEIGEINDILIMQVIVPDTKSCYDALGKIHESFKPIPGKFKDFIAIPEYSIYQALHTQIIGPSKKPIKIYIQSEKMHLLGVDGVIALLKNNEGKKILKKFGKIFSKVKKEKFNDIKDVANSLSLDFDNKSMVVFTEKGETVEIPQQSTAIDFAYFAYGRKAEHASKANINGKILPLWTKLNPGDRIKIIYSPKSEVQVSWLSLASSEKVRQDIEKTLKKIITPKQSEGFAKIRIDSIDKPGLLMKLSGVLFKNGFNIETGITKVNEDGKTGYTEFIVKTKKGTNLENAIKKLKSMKETIEVSVHYLT